MVVFPAVLAVIGAFGLARWIFWVAFVATVAVIGLYVAQRQPTGGIHRARRQP